MKQIHFDSIDSTQTYLIKNSSDLLSESEQILISCESQIAGHGQYERKWDSDFGTLCVSFTLKPNPTITLSSLEVGLLIAQYFVQNFDKKLYLKWPNDIYDLEGNKYGGIIINTSGDSLVVGVGLNLYKAKDEVVDYKKGFIFHSDQTIDKESFAKDLYQYILENRLSPQETIDQWEKICVHMNQFIQLKDQKKELVLGQGEFIGIGKFGEAILKTEDGPKPFYTGSLVF